VKVNRRAENLVVHLGDSEKHLLFELLKLYPRIPPAHQSLTRSGGLPDQPANQKLLDEALADHRTERKKQVHELLANPARLQRIEPGWRLTISLADAEWLLQVLNDIRVGSWILLGAPEPSDEYRRLNQRTALHFWAMKMAGDFQMDLIEALGPR